MSTPGDSDSTLEADLLVIGAGMAGLSAASWAARHGANVIVVEKSPAIGGSAVLSGGGLWTLADPGLAESLDEAGDPALARILAHDYASAAQWVEDLGAAIQPPARTDAIQGFPSVARVIDVLGYLRLCAAEVRAADGWVVTEAEPIELICDNKRIRGALIRDKAGVTRVHAPWTLLATGGFGGDPELRRTLIGEHAADLPLRANAFSTGGGISLGRSAGAALRPPTTAFYGHLMAAPLDRPLGRRDFLRLAQIASPRTLLLDQTGNRFVDESKSYYNNASAVALLPPRRALMIADDAIRQYDLTAYRGTETIDRFYEAQREGAHVARVDTLDGLDAAVGPWGYKGAARAVTLFNEQIRLDQQPVPARTAHRRALNQPPIWAMEVSPAITMNFRGLIIDAEARVLDVHAKPIPGLLAAGADACFYGSTYFGGLALGLVFGLRAAQTSCTPKQTVAGAHG